jgi:hypothetical protein
VLIDRLVRCPAGQGYGRFVLGLLCTHAGRRAEAKAYLRAFVDRTAQAQPTMAIALEGELRRACELLARIESEPSDEPSR